VGLFGGSEPSGAISFDDTWDGTEWRQIANTGPSGRGFPAMVFDSSRECLVLFGGQERGEWLGDTWEWGDDTGWLKRQDMGPRSITTPTRAYTVEGCGRKHAAWGVADAVTADTVGTLKPRPTCATGSRPAGLM
jgi:hypothetical protein